MWLPRRIITRESRERAPSSFEITTASRLWRRKRLHLRCGERPDDQPSPRRTPIVHVDTVTVAAPPDLNFQPHQRASRQAIVRIHRGRSRASRGILPGVRHSRAEILMPRRLATPPESSAPPCTVHLSTPAGKNRARLRRRVSSCGRIPLRYGAATASWRLALSLGFARPRALLMPPPGVEAAALCRRSHWVPKSSRSACSNCRRGFKLFAGKHHCRLCGEVVCKACSGRRILFQTAAVRVCDDCVATNVQPVLARRQSLPDARFHGRASSRALLSTGRRSLPMDPELPTSASGLKHGSSSSDLPASARGRAASAGKRRARKDQQRADGLVLGEWRSIVHWNYSSSHVATAVFALCLAVLASLLAAAARK